LQQFPNQEILKPIFDTVWNKGYLTKKRSGYLTTMGPLSARKKPDKHGPRGTRVSFSKSIVQAGIYHSKPIILFTLSENSFRAYDPDEVKDGWQNPRFGVKMFEVLFHAGDVISDPNDIINIDDGRKMTRLEDFGK
jgi:hypothetical protein